MIVAIAAAICLCLVIERFRPGWMQPTRQEWRLRVLFLGSFELCAVFLIGLIVKDWWLLPSLLDWSDLHPSLGGLLTYLSASFFFYWWHRARHECGPLWRIFHQLHHSAGRLETLTAFYKHPLEVAANSLASSLLVYLVFGLDLSGAAVYTSITVVAQLMVHLNTKTPQMLGYFFQRPEMHRIHHRPGSEHLNYADIPLWDILFGTFHNTAEFDGNCGFSPQREARLGDMLMFCDVHTKANSNDMSAGNS